MEQARQASYPGQCLLPVVSSGTASAAGGFLTCWELRRRDLGWKTSPLVSLLSVTFPLTVISILQGQSLRNPGPATNHEAKPVFFFPPRLSYTQMTQVGLGLAEHPG